MAIKNPPVKTARKPAATKKAARKPAAAATKKAARKPAAAATKKATRKPASRAPVGAADATTEKTITATVTLAGDREAMKAAEEDIIAAAKKAVEKELRRQIRKL